MFNSELLGKLEDQKNAFRMLKLLSDKTYYVLTSVAVIVDVESCVFSDS